MRNDPSEWLRGQRARDIEQEVQEAARVAGDLAWLRELRVDTNDERAAEGITPAGVAGYLAAYGWEKVSVHTRHPAEFWRHPTYRVMSDLMIPTDPTYDDHRRRILGLAKALAGHSKRGLLDVLLDLREASR
jgi:hypothetical protein